jgi:hypothetical protein
LHRDVGEQGVARDARVVDQDVDLEAVVGGKVLAGGGDELGGAGGGADVCLYRDGLDVVGGGELGCEGGCRLGGGGRGVVEDEVAALGGEVLGDGGADAWVTC